MKARPKMQGLLPTEILLLVEAMLRNGRTLGQVRESVGDTMGVKCHAIVMLSQAFPGVEFVRRMTADALASDYLHFSDFSLPDLDRLRRRLSNTTLEELNKKVVANGWPAQTILGEAEFLDYIEEMRNKKHMVKLTSYDQVNDKLRRLLPDAREKVCKHILKVLKEM